MLVMGLGDADANSALVLQLHRQNRSSSSSSSSVAAAASADETPLFPLPAVVSVFRGEHEMRKKEALSLMPAAVHSCRARPADVGG